MPFGIRNGRSGVKRIGGRPFFKLDFVDVDGSGMSLTDSFGAILEAFAAPWEGHCCPGDRPAGGRVSVTFFFDFFVGEATSASGLLLTTFAFSSIDPDLSGSDGPAAAADVGGAGVFGLAALALPFFADVDPERRDCGWDDRASHMRRKCSSERCCWTSATLRLCAMLSQ